QPYAVALGNRGPMLMAGLWDVWKSPADGDWMRSCTIITTDANELLASVHDRMPVIRGRFHDVSIACRKIRRRKMAAAQEVHMLTAAIQSKPNMYDRSTFMTWPRSSAVGSAGTRSSSAGFRATWPLWGWS